MKIRGLYAKKLLSFLLIGGLIASSSINVVSCGSNTTNESDKVRIDTGELELFEGQNIYDDIRDELAVQANVERADIKNDDEIGIAFKEYGSGGDIGPLLPQNTVSVRDEHYYLSITVTEKDIYFKTTVDDPNGLGHIWMLMPVTNMI